jgi:hypothetical protein
MSPNILTVLPEYILAIADPPITSATNAPVPHSSRPHRDEWDVHPPASPFTTASNITPEAR